MNFKNFSLDYLEPTVSVATKMPVVSAPWQAAIKYYGEPVLKILQNGGPKTVRELFDITKEQANAKDLGLDQFDEIIKKMISETKVLTIVKSAETLEDSTVALDIKL